MNNFYVYLYLDPRKSGEYIYGEERFEYEPFYVGKGRNGRAYRHLTGKGYNKHLNSKIKKIQNEKYIPIVIKWKENIDEAVAFEFEMYLIKTIGRHDINMGPLCNHTKGGEGSSGHICSEETRKLWSKQRLGAIPWNKGLKGYLSEETRKKMGSSKKRKYSIEIERKAVEMRKSMTVNRVSEIMNISKNTIEWWCKINKQKSKET